MQGGGCWEMLPTFRWYHFRLGHLFDKMALNGFFFLLQSRNIAHVPHVLLDIAHYFRFFGMTRNLGMDPSKCTSSLTRVIFRLNPPVAIQLRARFSALFDQNLTLPPANVYQKIHKQSQGRLHNAGYGLHLMKLNRIWTFLSRRVQYLFYHVAVHGV